MRCYLLAIALLLGAAQAGFAQSQTGSNFGVPYSGSAASRSNNGVSSYVHVRRHTGSDTGDQGSNGSSGNGSSGGGREIDARDAEGSTPVARQASTPR
jgi:hypothetical protein